MKISTLCLCIMLMESTPYKRYLSEEERRLRDRRYPRCAVQPFKYSNFYHLYESKNDQALANATGHDFNSFDNLLRLFAPVYNLNTYDEQLRVIRPKILDAEGNRKGRPRDLPACGCLGLILMWYRTKGSCARTLAVMFGQTSTPMYKWLKFGRRVLLHVLSRTPEAQVKLPIPEEVASFKEAVADKYPFCPDVWGTADGLKLLIEPPGSYDRQLRYYNGWKASHFINYAFTFSVDGKIRVAVLNAPGNFHDSNIADYGLYERLEFIYNRDGGQVVVDSAYKVGDAPFLIKSSNIDPFNEDEILINRDATSIRQLSEWGMRIIQSSFPRLREPLRYGEDGDRFIILRLMTNLYNYQTEMMGSNMIYNSYIGNDNDYYGYEIDEYFNF